MDPWHYDTAADLDRTPIERLRNFPREPDMLVYLLRLAAAIGARAWLRVFHRLRIEGREHLPRSGSFVLVANHSSHLDALCLLAALPLSRIHHAFPAAARDYFFVNTPRMVLASIGTNAMPFERTRSPSSSLSLCRQVLDHDGACLILFPEGSRSRDGSMAPFRPGIGLIVAGTDTPVMPCRLDGAFEAWPRGRRWPRPRAVTLRIGAARRYAELPRGKQSAERIAAELEAAVRRLGEP